ncbi:MAG TPA: ROK family transcriptional regulator [Sphingobacterium sp.]|nr:ROK family transcriptional regulator [Sphingobacterium sp.]
MKALKELLDEASVRRSSRERKSAFNKLRLLKAVFNKEMMSIGELSKELGLSFPTVNALILDLQDRGVLVAKDKGESIGGRKPLLYKVNDNAFTVLCMEVERFSVRLVVLDNNNNEVYPSRSYPYDISVDISQAEDLVGVIRSYVADLGVDYDSLSAIGLNMPGLVDSSLGTNQTFYVEEGFNIRDFLTQKLDKYVAVINDVKAAALSELLYGAAQNKKNVLVILMDWGIGLGIIINGQIYMGNNGFSGEMGHMVFEEDGDLCYCGKRGCLETIASGVYLVNQARADIENGMPSLLKNFVDVKNLQPQHIIKVATQGDQYAIDLISSLGKNLGKAISMLIQILNPEAVVLSGKFAQAGALITIPIQQSLNTYTMNVIGKNCEVEVSSLGINGYAKGLVRFTFDKYFEDRVLAEFKINE